MTSPANRGCALTFSFYRTLSSRSSWRGTAGPQAARSAVAAGHMVLRASLRAWRIEGYPSEGISSMKTLRNSIDALGPSKKSLNKRVGDVAYLG